MQTIVFIMKDNVDVNRLEVEYEMSGGDLADLTTSLNRHNVEAVEFNTD